MLLVMQLTLFPDERASRLLFIHQRLHRCYGPPGPFWEMDPVSQLVMGLIGGRTRGQVSAEVFLRLKRHFADWESLRDAPERQIHTLIAPVTFAEVKAPRLKAALGQLTAERGRLTLDFLAAMSVSASLAWLERLPGVGRKTAATVLNFSTLRKPVLVIDTHHLRVARRLGLVGRRATIEQAYGLLAPLLPADWTAASIDIHHQLLKLHGQRLCRPRRPACGVCVLRDLCAFGSEVTR